MKSVARPGRLVLAVLLAALVAVDVVLLDEYAPAVVLLAGLLSLVLVVGSVPPFAESEALLASLLVVQLLIAAFLSARQHYVLVAVVGLAVLDTGRLLRNSRRKPEAG